MPRRTKHPVVSPAPPSSVKPPVADSLTRPQAERAHSKPPPRAIDVPDLEYLPGARVRSRPMVRVYKNLQLAMSRAFWHLANSEGREHVLVGYSDKLRAVLFQFVEDHTAHDSRCLRVAPVNRQRQFSVASVAAYFGIPKDVLIGAHFVEEVEVSGRGQHWAVFLNAEDKPEMYQVSAPHSDDGAKSQPSGSLKPSRKRKRIDPFTD